MVARDYRVQLTGARLQTLEFERRYDEAAVKLRPMPSSGADFKVAVQLPAIVGNQRTPQRLMEVVAGALDMTPEIRLQHLRWVIRNDLNEDALREYGSVEGEIINSSADYRAALDSVNRLVELIRNDAQVESVAVEQKPVNASAYPGPQGNMQDVRTQELPSTLFKLNLMLKPVTRS
ncbi:hypothetical protein GALL_397230 [mine drainage metagenome]|uniref:Uncharacterized protein n=1 Tax=mine drainage metagenome TaxID=410659 RepID=A0A1J5Q5Q1_9ZZZZ